MLVLVRKRRGLGGGGEASAGLGEFSGCRGEGYCWFWCFANSAMVLVRAGGMVDGAEEG